MEKLIIALDGVDYKVEEPTMEGWAQLTLLQDLEQEEDFTLGIVSMCTSIDEELLKQASYIQVKRVADYLSDYFINEGSVFYPEFEFENTKYKFVDINNISFGHFIDIDAFLKKDPSYKKGRFNELMALLYWPESQIKYDSSLNGERSELFKKLPVKYLQGTLRFFFNLKKKVNSSTPWYLKKYWRLKRILKKLLRHLRRFGDGIRQCISWLKKTYSTLTKSLGYLYQWCSTFLATQLSLIEKGKESIIKWLSKTKQSKK